MLELNEAPKKDDEGMGDTTKIDEATKANVLNSERSVGG